MREPSAFDRLDEIYADRKLRKCGFDPGYTVPEMSPKISSEQVKALLALLIERGVINE